MISTENWERVKPILADVLDLPASERCVRITALCGEDTSLASEVQAWLAAHDASAEFIEDPIVKLPGLGSPTTPDVGRYKIIRELGRGGMGAVYLAERSDGQFDQRVAVKVVRRSLADPSLVDRFRSERQILATLDHPYIARLLDGGVTGDSEPYFVMEYVEGDSVLDYAAKQKLGTKDMLRLFLKICAALSYSHRNLVVHRDIKPGNILVTADGDPKLLDFGLARLLADPMAAADATQTGLRALTPAYASPEQLANAPITTSTDVYSLGIVLFELLTGEKPFRHEGRTLDDISRVIASTDPRLPSSIGDKALKGDIDNIVITALRREPELRYESIDALSADVERHLEGLPVRARPSTVRYRTSKFISRHRIGVAFTVLILLLLVAGTIFSVWQAKKAEQERVKAETVNTFLQTMLGYTDNSVGIVSASSRETTVNDVLQNASQRLEKGELSDQPAIKAELQRIIGSSYLTQGKYDEAERNLSSALDLKTQLFGAQSPETLPILVDLAQLYVTTSRFPEAEKIYDQRLAILRTDVQERSADPTYLMIALNDYAVMKRAEGDSPTAESLMKECLALEPRIPPENAMVAGVARSVFALILSDSGRFDEAEEIVRQRIAEIRKKPEAGTIELASSLNALGGFLIEKGQTREALDDLIEAEQIFRKLTGPRHLPLGDNLRYQAQALLELGETAQAGIKIDEALQIYRASARPNFINFPTALTIKSRILLKENKVEEADGVITDAMTLRQRDLPKRHFLTAVSRETLALVRAREGRIDDAMKLLDQSADDLRSSQVEGSPRLARVEALRNELMAANVLRASDARQ